MATITLEYCGMEASGPTVTKAKQEAARKIEAALKGSYDPEVLTLGKQAYLLWRDPRGWHSRSLTDECSIRSGTVYGSSGSDSYEECKSAALLQLGMNAWHSPDDTAMVLAAMDKKQRDELRSWIGFQLAYRHKRTQGDIPESQIHEWACNHSREFAPAA